MSLWSTLICLFESNYFHMCIFMFANIVKLHIHLQNFLRGDCVLWGRMSMQKTWKLLIEEVWWVQDCYFFLVCTLTITHPGLSGLLTPCLCWNLMSTVLFGTRLWNAACNGVLWLFPNPCRFHRGRWVCQSWPRRLRAAMSQHPGQLPMCVWPWLRARARQEELRRYGWGTPACCRHPHVPPHL